MENIKNKISYDTQLILKNLSIFLDTKLYFYGSVQRYDYFHEYSDIDASIFTDNTLSTINKMKGFFHNSTKDYVKILWKLDNSQKVIQGYKMMYKDLEKKVVIEFTIFEEKYKKEILEEQLKKQDLPFYITILLIILKTLYYRWGVISGDTYKYYKRFIMNTLLTGKEMEFIIL